MKRDEEGVGGDNLPSCTTRFMYFLYRSQWTNFSLSTQIHTMKLSSLGDQNTK